MHVKLFLNSDYTFIVLRLVESLENKQTAVDVLHSSFLSFMCEKIVGVLTPSMRQWTSVSFLSIFI